MLEGGWVVISTARDVSHEHGDSVFYDLEREGVEIELEYYEHGELVAYPTDQAVEDGDSTEPVFDLEEPTEAECLEAFIAQGWVQARGS